MNRRFKLIFGSVAFFAGVLLMVFCLSHFISTLLMLIGVIFILNVLIERKSVFLVVSIILTLLTVFVYVNIYGFRGIERVEQRVNKIECIENE
ncbi:MAG TPA: hypothetical protein H9796_02900 [Candidatus Butyricimonas faecavium]|nr:hypothetical protein [Candidatus Butyricimonas faecavium]